jgi:hypothetical protein
MMKPRSLVTMFALAAMMVAAACSTEKPVSPVAPNAGLLDPITGLVSGLVNGLVSCPTSTSYTTTKTIGTGGGTINVGPHSLVIPSGALSSNVSITATAPAGQHIKVEFKPEGLKFAKTSALTMSYKQCNLVSGLLSKLLFKVVYVDNNNNVLEVLPSVMNLLKQNVTGSLKHFSAYAVAE